MLDDENQDQSNQKISFESLDILIGKWKDGTFSEIIDDWKRIFQHDHWKCDRSYFNKVKYLY